MESLQSTLMTYLSQVPDFRHARGQRYSWSYLLALVAAAVAAGQRNVVAMVSWAHAHRQELLAALQPACPRLPSAATCRGCWCTSTWPRWKRKWPPTTRPWTVLMRRAAVSR